MLSGGWVEKQPSALARPFGRTLNEATADARRRQRKAERLMQIARVLLRSPKQTGKPEPALPASRREKKAFPRSLRVVRAEHASALRQPRKALRPRSLTEILSALRQSSFDEPDDECETAPVAASVPSVALPQHGVSVEWLAPMPDTRRPDAGKKDELKTCGAEVGTAVERRGGEKEGLLVLCCRCGVVLDTAEGITIRPAIGDCDAGSCNHWACVPCSGEEEGYAGKWLCGCARCGQDTRNSPHHTNVSSGVISLAAQVSSSSSAHLVGGRKTAVVDGASGGEAHAHPLVQHNHVSDGGNWSPRVDSESDDEPADHIPLSQRKRKPVGKPFGGPPIAKFQTDACLLTARTSTAQVPKVPRVRLKLNGLQRSKKSRKADEKNRERPGVRSSSTTAGSKQNGGETYHMKQETKNEAEVGDSSDASATAATAGKEESGPQGQDSDGCTQGTACTSDLDSPCGKEGPSDSLSELFRQDEKGYECSRSVGARLVDRYRRRKARSSEARKLTMTSMVAPTWIDPAGAGGPDVASSSTVASRGSRRELRQLASILGQSGAKKVGDSSMSALTFNELTSRKKKVRLAKSAIHSWGLYAAEAIDAEDFVVEYIGEYVRASVAECRERKYRRLGYGDDYIFRVDADTLVDATRMGSVARFANHCCDPNCYTTIIKAGGKPRIVLYSKRPIELGEEITYNYNFDIDEDESLRIRCRCGAKSCKGYLN